MKNSFKMIPILAGFAFALLSSVNEIEAAVSEANLESVTGYGCYGSGPVCAITSNGTILFGYCED